jgi:hypothetical protein
MSLPGIVLGLINIAIVIVILLLVGVVVKWGIKWLFSHDTDPMMDKLYIAAVGLIALYMLVALIFGLPSWHIITPHAMLGSECAICTS